jgi:hypothetical protein
VTFFHRKLFIILDGFKFDADAEGQGVPVWPAGGHTADLLDGLASRKNRLLARRNK